ncbi:hypothetical protein SEA_SAKAI_45 [Arthrobacter phage Sakai]|nr:hypothetical protein SEA_GORPY_46 [Arthrobacter phage Gorpy]UVK61992.1 hypothetical protein SEA_SAKAI_45 [Arthrobacter phage Sakai]
MPNISPPPTTEACAEIERRLQTIGNQIAEAERMVTYYNDQAAQQASAAAELKQLYKSYIGLLEDAGAEL